MAACLGARLFGHAAPAQAADAALATWSYGGKSGIGTAYEAYGKPAKSLVWFSLAQGMVTETMFGMIHETQLKDLGFSFQGPDFVETEAQDFSSEIAYLDQDAAGRPQSPAYRILSRSRSGHVEIEKQVFTDPNGNSLFLHVTIHAKDSSITPTLLAHPALNGYEGGEHADSGKGFLHVEKGGTHLVIRSQQGLRDLAVGSVGHASGAPMELSAKLAALSPGKTEVYDFVLGFGHSSAEAEQAAEQTLARGHDQVLADYSAAWHGYLAQLSALPDLAREANDGGRLLYASAMVLKTQEDKLHPGALIASLSTPWGDKVSAAKPSTGYRAVWPRDFYQCAMALLALGDRETPVMALNYLKTVQVTATTQGNAGASGWFLQKTHVDGTVEWIGVQLDQTAMPLMLAWKIWQAGLVSDAQITALYRSNLKAAASFLATGGDVAIGWNHIAITPPSTQQERWEEQPGYSPSTSAAVIAGLVVAGEIAELAGDGESAQRDRSMADKIHAELAIRMASRHSPIPGQGDVPPHFLRIAPTGQPDSHDRLQARNGKQGLAEESYLDAGFLELVRYGVTPPQDPLIQASLLQLDDPSLPDDLRVRYDLTMADGHVYPGWRRYSDDGYGEDVATGANYGAQIGDRLEVAGDTKMSPTQRGRIWPIFTGERGHYALALAASQPGGVSPADRDKIRTTYVRALELFANQGLMLPEQVWDGVGANPEGRFRLGAGTGSATPLSWAHAEYIKLLRSLHDGQVWDRYPPVIARFPAASQRPAAAP